MGPHRPLNAFRAPRFDGLASTSERASAAARAASRKTGTRPEVALRRALYRAGIRYRKNAFGLPGKPDIVLFSLRVAIFCDGDFWHGKDLEVRKEKLRQGANSAYWIRKISRNVERDIEHNRQLEQLGWLVLRYWETQILGDIDSVVGEIRQVSTDRIQRMRRTKRSSR